MFFGVEDGDSELLYAISEGVKDYAGKYSFVWVDVNNDHMYNNFLRKHFGCETKPCAILNKGRKN